MEDARSFDPAPPTLWPRFRREVGAAVAAQHGAALRALLDAVAAAGRSPEARARALDAYQDEVARAWRRYHARLLGDPDAPITHRALRRWEALRAQDEPSPLNLPEAPPHLRERLYDQQRALRAATRAGWWLMRDLAPRLEALARTHRPLRVLDLACGAGDLTAALAREARRRGIALELTAADQEEVALQMTREALQGVGADVELRLLAPRDLSALASGAVDLVFGAGLLHRLRPDAIARLLVEARRVSTGGIYLVDLACAPGLASLARLLPLAFDEALAQERLLAAQATWSRSDLGFIAALTDTPGLRARLLPLALAALDNLLAVDDR
jgi:SAM-dependent methyltransferase